MLDIVGLHAFRPLGLEMVYLTGHLLAVLQIEGLVNLGIPAFSQQGKYQVAVFQNLERLRLFPAIFRAFLIFDSVQFCLI